MRVCRVLVLGARTACHQWIARHRVTWADAAAGLGQGGGKEGIYSRLACWPSGSSRRAVHGVSSGGHGRRHGHGHECRDGHAIASRVPPGLGIRNGYGRHADGTPIPDAHGRCGWWASYAWHELWRGDAGAGVAIFHVGRGTTRVCHAFGKSRRCWRLRSPYGKPAGIWKLHAGIAGGQPRCRS